MNEKNPLTSNISKAKAAYRNFVITIFIIIFVLVFPLFYGKFPSPFAATYLSIPLAILAYRFYMKHWELKQPVALSSHSWSFGAALKNRQILRITLALQLTDRPDASALRTRFEIVINSALAHYCSKCDEIPTLKQVERCAENAVERENQELQLPFIRCYVTAIAPEATDPLQGIYIGQS